jgi:hypothetical protein
VALPECTSVERTIAVRTFPTRVAQPYAGQAYEPRSEVHSAFWLVELPQGETLASVQAKWEGRPVYAGDKYTRRHLYKAVAVPDEYAPLVEGRNAALFLASEPLAY